MSTTQLSVNREATRRRTLLTLKKYSYLIAMVPLVLPPLPGRRNRRATNGRRPVL